MDRYLVKENDIQLYIPLFPFNHFEVLCRPYKLSGMTVQSKDGQDIYRFSNGE